MSTLPKGKPWDFSHVLDLANALSSPPVSDTHENHAYFSSRTSAPLGNQDHSNHVEQGSFAQPAARLGDFGKIWQFLGTQSSQEHATDGISRPETASRSAFASKYEYTSDGAIRYGSRNREKKKVTWKEDTSADEPEHDSASELSATPTPAAQTLTKSQRKKQNRRERKAREVSSTPGTVSESEADNMWPATPARKASIHPAPATVYHHGPRQRPKLPSNTVSENEAPAKSNGVNSDTKTSNVHMNTNIRQSSQPVLPTLGSIHSTTASAQWPVPATRKNDNLQFYPSTVTPKVCTPQESTKASPAATDLAAQAILAVQVAQTQLNGNRMETATPRRQPTIEPKIVRSGEDRHWALLLKLISEYNEDRRYLVAPMNMTTHNNDPNGIHIFVDASNIFIGFNDQLKRSRGIPLAARVPSVNLSFDALALLMERRRPVAKRILVGSTPHLPAFDKAKAVGYECNILEKVYKARELTDRQIFFRDADRRHSGRAKASRSSGLPSISPSGGFYSDSGDYSGQASGSETMSTGPQFAPARMIEQGVDEILHLKILESIVDSEAPATMVIATGDAAQAEYSDGFMAMTLRALKKGWNIELVSWSKNISSMYLRQSFRDTWGAHFRVIFLDDYAEELLDM